MRSFLQPIFFAKKEALANRLAAARRSGDEEAARVLTVTGLGH
jgi:hypothetical protein